VKRTILVYAGLLVVFGLVICLTLEWGQLSFHSKSPAGASPALVDPAASKVSTDFASEWTALRENIEAPLGRLLLQFIVILAATRSVGAIFRRFGQPAVIGEMAAGILLGPSLLGWLWPEAFEFVFAGESLQVLRLFSEIGVCLFMFVVGMELELSRIRQSAHTAFMVSHASIIFPYFLGVVTALWLYPSYAGGGVSFVTFALFMGIALSITAFPVLARVLEDRAMTKSFLGVTALACAAVNDVTAWSILAFVVAIARVATLTSTALCLGLLVVFVAAMLWVVRPRLPHWFGVDRINNGEPGRAVLSAVLIIMTASALATEAMGIHALFGAFLAGVVMPRQKRFRECVTLRLGNFSSLFLLPLFFAFSGLRTHVGLLNDATSWLVCLAIIGVATVGKLGGTAVSARLTGMSWNDAFALGALMNTRGLVELVALNIGYDLGILPPTIFAMMVLMSLVTTFLTGPLLNVTEPVTRRAVPVIHAQPVRNS
jgi:Kef-type K+ transport system membrane component KefB